MKVDQKGHTITIKDTQGDLALFLGKITQEYKSFKNHNIILDLSAYKNLSVKEINSFLPLCKQHFKEKKSFVIVANDIDFNAISSLITLVPSTLEASDTIDIEEIERDLGF